MSSDLSTERYSTVADFELISGGRSYDVAQLAGDFIILDRPTSIPAGPAKLIIRISDGKVIERDIEVVEGSNAGSTHVSIIRH